MKSELEYVSTITELNDLSDFMKNEYLDEAMDNVVKLVMKPDIPSAAAQKLIVQLQAVSAMLNMQKAYYMTIEKGGVNTEAGQKKIVYTNAVESINLLVQALKYRVKDGF